MEGFSPQRSPHSSRSPHPSRSPHLPPGSRSPHLPPGSRSPMMSAPDRDPGNPLKVSIALGQKPAIIQKGPFYLMKPEPIVMSEVTGATNLMANKNLEHSFQKLAAKKMKDSLSSFLPGLPGMVDINSQQDNSSLRQVIEKPPVGGKELLLLNQVQLSGFRLHPGPLPEQYRTLLNQMPTKEKKKHKKNKKHRGGDTPAGDDKTEEERRERKKHKKRDHDSDGGAAKKKKKEKKKKSRREDKDI